MSKVTGLKEYKWSIEERNQGITSLFKALTGRIRIYKALPGTHEAAFIVDTPRDKTTNKPLPREARFLDPTQPDTLQDVISWLGTRNYLIRTYDYFRYQNIEETSQNDPRDVLFIIDLDKHDDATDGIKYFKENLKDRYGFHETFFCKTKSDGVHLYYYISEEHLSSFGIQKIDGLFPGIDIKFGFTEKKFVTIIGPGSQREIKGKPKERYYVPENIIGRKIQPLPLSFFEEQVVPRAKTISLSEKESRENYLEAKRLQTKYVAFDSEDNKRKAYDEIKDLIFRDSNELRDTHNTQCLVTQDFPGRNSRLHNRLSRFVKYTLGENTYFTLARMYNKGVFYDNMLNEEELQTISKSVAQYQESYQIIPSLEIQGPYHTDEFDNIIYTYEELIRNIDIFPATQTTDHLTTNEGVSVAAKLIFYTIDGRVYTANRSKFEAVISRANWLLANHNPKRFGFERIQESLEQGEISFSKYNNIRTFQFHHNHDIKLIGEYAPNDNRKKRYVKLHEHPLFNEIVARGLTATDEIPKHGNVIEKRKLYRSSPYTLDMLPQKFLLADDEIEEQMPLINELFDFFHKTIANPDNQDERDYLIDLLSIIAQDINAPRFTILHGENGNGKSNFLQLCMALVSRSSRKLFRSGAELTSRFSEFKPLIVVDDSDLGTIRSNVMDFIKTLSSNEEHAYEAKGETPIDVRMNINILFATNRDVPGRDLPEDRRTVILHGEKIHENVEDYSNEYSSLVRRLVYDDLKGFRALYQFLLNREIKNLDQPYRTQYQKALIKQNHQIIIRHGHIDPAKATAQLQQEIIEKEQKHFKIALAIYVNFGYSKSDMWLNPTIELSHPHIENNSALSTRIIARTPTDHLYMMRYFATLIQGKSYKNSNHIINPETFVLRNLVNGDSKTLLSNFVRNCKESNSSQRMIMGNYFNDKLSTKAATSMKKIVSDDFRYKYDHITSLIRGRILINAPVGSIITRIHKIGNRNATNNDLHELIEEFNLKPIMEIYKQFKNKGWDRIPTKATCQEALSLAFPDENPILGQFVPCGADYEFSNVDLVEEEIEEEDFDI